MGRELLREGIQRLRIVLALLQRLALIQAIAIAADACGHGEQQASEGHGNAVHRLGPQLA